MNSQILQDDFEGNGSINNWTADNLNIKETVSNPFKKEINTSSTVLEYHDIGGEYANLKFDVSDKINLSSNSKFSLMVYVPSSGLTGSQKNQISLKLQNGTLGEPWTTQTEIIKSIAVDKWQTVTFDFKNDAYLNLDKSSPAPALRTDFDRVLIQINGENNTDKVLAYIDNFYFDNIVAIVTTTSVVFDKLVWSDEFEVEGAINGQKWFHQTQLPPGGSWYNNEIQHYTNRIENSFVKDGLLNITAKKETFSNQGTVKSYTSARLNSKYAFKYGKVEVRAKLPTGVGTWPAIWMLGKNINEDGGYWDNEGFGTTNWPACGEIDMMEHWGDNQNFIQSALHTPSSSGNTFNKGGKIVSTASTDFHVYKCEWTSEKLVFSVDNVKYYTYNPVEKTASTWPFDSDQYFLLNLAIQSKIEPTFSKGSMLIDYIRVYQQGDAVTSALQSDKREIQTSYPNPVNDELTINLVETIQKNLALKVYNNFGSVVKTYFNPINSNIVSLTHLNDLPKGLYVVLYELDGTNYRLKFVKK
ncbi:MAG: family 16 glycosylhydrolase [Cytophagales bacterium]